MENLEQSLLPQSGMVKRWVVVVSEQGMGGMADEPVVVFRREFL